MRYHHNDLTARWRRLKALAIKYSLYPLLDIALITLSLLVAQELRFSGDVPPYFAEGLRRFIVPAILSTLGFNAFFGIYRRLWRAAGAEDAVMLAQAAFLNMSLLTLLTFFWPSVQPVPLSVTILGGLLYLCGSTLVRFRWRFLQALQARLFHNTSNQRVLLVGAGKSGELFVRHARSLAANSDLDLVGFVDDDPRKQGMLVQGVRVLGGRDRIPDIVSEYDVDLIVITVHAMTGVQFRSLLDICNETNAQVKVLPDVLGHLRARQHMPLLRDVTVEDLLGRQPVEIDDQGCRALVTGNVVLVTGAAGSIGSEICRQILAFQPRRLVLLDNNESGLYDLQVELSARNFGNIELHYIIASITDKPKIEGVFQRYAPALVFHAAAYKHVPLMESFPEEAVRVNVGGTVVLLECAERHRVARFVLVSTDKAVDPQSVMGATKRIGEILTLSAGQGTTSRFTAVRFGNVLNSRGSVVPTFEKQIEMGGPVTVTDPDMKRFFMSIPEAVSLVIQAATLTEGNDLFMLEMGEEISIARLAERMIRLRGLRVGQDIEVRYTGVRPGEKLRESLNATRESREPTEHPAIYRLTGTGIGIGAGAKQTIRALVERASSADQSELRQAIFHALVACEAEKASAPHARQVNDVPLKHL